MSTRNFQCKFRLCLEKVKFLSFLRLFYLYSKTFMVFSWCICDLISVLSSSRDQRLEGGLANEQNENFEIKKKYLFLSIRYLNVFSWINVHLNGVSDRIWIIKKHLFYSHFLLEILRYYVRLLFKTYSNLPFFSILSRNQL